MRSPRIGSATGIIASALLFIREDFDLSSFEQGLVVSAVPVGAVFGAALAGTLADAYGRKRMIVLSAILFVAGSVVSALAGGVAVLVAARIALGWAIGVASAACPVYISEVAPAAVAVAASILTSAYYILQRGTNYEDLGSDYFLQRNIARAVTRHCRQLEQLGYKVTLEKEAA